VTGLFDRLVDRDLPTEPVCFPADRAGWDRAHTELQDAEAALLDAQRRGLPPEQLADLEAARDAAQARVDELPRTDFTVRALPPKQWEDLVGEHQPTDPDSTLQWVPSFYPALLEHTVSSDGETLTAAQWEKLFDSPRGLTLAEKNTLINAALNLNTRASVVSPAVGKDSAATRR
jgi:hypothetical protein